MDSRPDAPAPANDNQNPESEARKPVVAQIHSTGDRWTDLKLAVRVRLPLRLLRSAGQACLMHFIRNSFSLLSFAL